MSNYQHHIRLQAAFRQEVASTVRSFVGTMTSAKTDMADICSATGITPANLVRVLNGQFEPNSALPVGSWTFTQLANLFEIPIPA